VSVTPYENEKSKKEQVAEMFDNISHRYDFLNRSLSFGIDVIWRKKTVKRVKKHHPVTILDIATGTADLAIALRKTGAKQITGVDISEGMLAKGREKVAKRGLSDLITLKYGDSEHLPFADETFDVVTVAFGVRNFEHPLQGLQEILRVLKKGGSLYVLEFSKPEHFPVKQLYGFYFKNVLPAFGRMVSKDQSAYTYLPNSVDAFPHGRKFLDMMEKAGFTNSRHKPLSFGISTIYSGQK
jgi:demethylmenaquinone methyltransferase/2-methoxy-6-polyprenyl-1,4-benzoquinol methylase